MLNPPKISLRQNFPHPPKNSKAKPITSRLNLDFTKTASPKNPEKSSKYSQVSKLGDMTPINIDQKIPSINMFLVNGGYSPRSNYKKVLDKSRDVSDSNFTDRSAARSNPMDRLTEIENLENLQVDRHETIKYLEKGTRGNIYCPELWGKTFYEGILKRSGIFEIFEDKKRLAWISLESKTDLQESHLNSKFPELKIPAHKQYTLQALKKINNYTSFDFFNNGPDSEGFGSQDNFPPFRSNNNSAQPNIPAKSSNFAKMANQTPEILNYFNFDTRRHSQPLGKSKNEESKVLNSNNSPASMIKEIASTTGTGFHSARGYSRNKPISPISSTFGFQRKTKDTNRPTYTSMNISNNETRAMSPETAEMIEKFETLQKSLQNFQSENSEFKEDIKNLSIEGLKDFQPQVVKRIARKAATRQDKVLIKLKKVVRMENPGKPVIGHGPTPFQLEMKKKINEIEEKASSPKKRKLFFNYQGNPK